ncbi:unnamed protein product [Spirodela intermedia]|uniref:Uncharacterized protein n=1 Tax=Spirodela intermedia TaxID=51605 RepID=A0A7I8JCK4_SPIIN|nr:unnamed protein product [Spirodela intermedia]CAA6667877.1 unnamed protein product [Spirodela intermedia]
MRTSPLWTWASPANPRRRAAACTAAPPSAEGIPAQQRTRKVKV